MSTSKRGLQAILRDIEHSPERSTLFWYMLDNYEDLSRSALGKRIRWAPLSERFAALGLLNGQGKAPTAENARLTWWNVRQEVAKRQAQDQHRAEPTIQPSRLPATWKPTPVEPTLARAISRPALSTNTDSAPAAPIELSEAARATLAALDRQLDWRDRYVIPPKRKD